MYRVVASNNSSTGAFEYLPKLPILRQRRPTTNSQGQLHNNATTMIQKDVPCRDSSLYHSQNVYRLHFSIIDKNRSWMRGTKRSIRWVFGLTNLASLRDGKVGRECRGEEHVVEIVRNKTSGKLRVVWNNCDITRYFRQRHFPLDSIFSCRNIEFSWTTRSGEVIRVVGSVNNDLSEESIRFDLYVDNIQFTELSTIGQLGRKLERSFDQRCPKDDSGSQRSLDSSLATNDLDTADQSSDLEQGFRLSMVGFNSMTSGEDEINDELHSNLYSNSLSSLRNQIVMYLPQTEEIVSRAIINAFVVESQDCEASYSFHTMAEVDCSQIEVDYMYEALCWVRLNVNVAPRMNVEDLMLQFLQRCVEQIFLSIRSEELNSEDAARIVCSVASVLGLEFAVDVSLDSIVLEGLPAGVSKETLCQILSQFGVLDMVSISSKAPTIAICRFVSENSLSQVMAAVERGVVNVNGVAPTIFWISTIPAGSNLLNESSSDELDEELVLKCDTKDRNDTMLAKIPTQLNDILLECNSSPTTIMTKIPNGYDFSEHNRSELEIHHHHHHHPRCYGSSSTAACY